MLGMQNVETLNSITRAEPLKIVATCPHCFNTLANEYPQLGGHFEVVHHTQLLGRLVADGRLTPVEPVDKNVTYHDPCYLGRHNKVYTPPRDVLAAIPALTSQEMHRCKDRGFCCGAGGARFWMEEKIGKRINGERTDEAIGLDPDLISTACPFCMVMLSDAVTEKKADGRPRSTCRCSTWRRSCSSRWPRRHRRTGAGRPNRSRRRTRNPRPPAERAADQPVPVRPAATPSRRGRWLYPHLPIISHP